jgi:hypothetical protein
MTPKQYVPRTMKGTGRSYADNPGKLFHGLLPGQDIAICGTQPGKTSAGWDSFVGKRVTCHKCLKRLALLPKDPTDDPDFILAELGRVLAREARYASAGKVDMAIAIVRAVSAIAHEILVRREISQPSPDQRQAVIVEASDAVSRVVAQQNKVEGSAEGMGDSADSAPFPVLARY